MISAKVFHVSEERDAIFLIKEDGNNEGMYVLHTKMWSKGGPKISSSVGPMSMEKAEAALKNVTLASAKALLSVFDDWLE